MLYLAFIWHMHQPYYIDLLTGQANLPWVRLHGIKDYLDMVIILEKYPKIHQTFNLVPSLLEQIKSLLNKTTKDKFFILSEKKAEELTIQEKQFIIENFFAADAQKILAIHPRYYQLYLKAKDKKEFNNQDILDLQVWLNLSWFDPYFREDINELNLLTKKARFFSEEDKQIILKKQREILEKIIPSYKDYSQRGQIEISVSPFYHPILPLLYNSKIAKESNKNTPLPGETFNYPIDCNWHIKEAVRSYTEDFGRQPLGMWPSEQAVSQHIISLLLENGINWIVTDEAILLKTLKRRKRKPEDIYKAYTLQGTNASLNILFRDKNLSDLIGFVYQYWDTEKSVDDFMNHLGNINKYFKKNDCLVAVALDGENAWEYYRNDGRDFLNLLYTKISESEFIKSVTVSQYLAMKPQTVKLKKIASGSWINGDFSKWIGNPAKNKAWELLIEARKLLDKIENPPELAWKQIHILEGSDWFWWYGDRQKQFDELFRMHLKNFYKIINQIPSIDLEKPLE